MMATLALPMVVIRSRKGDTSGALDLQRPFAGWLNLVHRQRY